MTELRPPLFLRGVGARFHHESIVYVVRDENELFYVGSTEDIEKRMRLHRSGATQTTRRMKNPQPALVQECKSIVVARKVERRIRALKSKKYIAKMVSDGYIKLEL